MNGICQINSKYIIFTTRLPYPVISPSYLLFIFAEIQYFSNEACVIDLHALHPRVFFLFYIDNSSSLSQSCSQMVFMQEGNIGTNDDMVRAMTNAGIIAYTVALLHGRLHFPMDDKTCK